MNKTIILLMLFLFIPSCGWQLKGNNYLSPDIENVDITVQSLDPQIKIKFKYFTKCLNLLFLPLC